MDNTRIDALIEGDKKMNCDICGKHIPNIEYCGKSYCSAECMQKAHDVDRLRLKKAARRECKRAKTALQSLLDYAAINGHLLSRAEDVVHAIDYFMTEVTIEIADHERDLKYGEET